MRKNDKLVQQMAKELVIRTSFEMNLGVTKGTRYEYQEAPEDVRKAFAAELAKIKTSTSFYFASPHGDGGQGLKEIFNKLPEPPQWGEYAFRCETIFTVPCPRTNSRAWNAMSPWVRSTLTGAKK